MSSLRILGSIDRPYQSTTEAISDVSSTLIPRVVKQTEDPARVDQFPIKMTRGFTLTQLAKRPSVEIEFHDLTYSVRQGGTTRDVKQILRNVSGKFRAGEMTAILGPSGAGKSSLLNILVGYVSAGVTGEIRTNGHPRQMKIFHKLSTYIMQEDLLQPRLTVSEAVKVAADLKLGNELTTEQKLTAVDEILETLGLVTCKDTMTERLSGGQRKRLSVALELVNNPPIIFLDEPTSGLDIVAIKQCVTFLKVLSGQGRTIVCTIHQPNASIFKMFDNLYVISRGQCVYQGSPMNLVPYLSSLGFKCPQMHNPADYVMEIIQGDDCADRVKLLSSEIQNGKLSKKNQISSETQTGQRSLLMTPDYDMFKVTNSDKNATVEFPTNFFTQFVILMRRSSIQMRRNKLAYWIQFLHHLTSASLLGGIYLGTGDQADNPFMNFKFSLSVLVFFMYTYVMTPVLIFPSEVKLLQREYFNRWYGLKSYYCAYTLCTIPGMVFFGLLFLSLSYILSDQPLDPLRFGRMSIVGLMVGAVSESFGMVVGSLLSIVNGSIVAPSILSPLLVLAAYGMGHGMTIEPLMNFLMSLSYLRYGIVGLSTALYGHDRPNMHCYRPENAYCHYEDPRLLLRDLGMEGRTTTNQVLALLAFYFIHRSLAYLALRFRLTREFSGRILNYVAKILRH